ncbi:MAG: sigma 54-interacting transcriptional regulator, partial [Acidobacteriota bacterium]|nr:sigma 54-interacting transcriptional regulator [Acidobacteriota bacterium]
LFGWSFLAATLLPLSSEAPLALLVRSHNQIVLPVLVATLGNYLGACTAYWLGRRAAQALGKSEASIVAATNRALPTMIEDGSFREDLYFRLAVVTIELPPLRERREDIPLLIEHFLERAVARHQRSGVRMSHEVFAALAAYPFPGNVRELENTVERMVVLAKGETLTLEDLPEGMRQGATQHAANVLLSLPPEGLSLEEVEREIIRQALLMHGGNQTRAARYLNITRSALIY